MTLGFVAGGFMPALCHISVMSSNANPFDRTLVRRRRDRAAASFEIHDFLVDEAAQRLGERLEDVRRNFHSTLDLGCHTGQLGRVLDRGGKVGCLVQCDLSEEMARRTGGLALAADEEALPFAEAQFDLVVSALALHRVNDLPGTLWQIQHVLKPDGLFLAALLGGNTLYELRHAWLMSEATLEGGASPRVAPLLRLEDAAGLLQRAGFALPVADSERITVTYDDPLKLMKELRGMGESNALTQRSQRPSRRDTLMTATVQYRELYGGSDGRVPATFDLIHLCGWAPDQSQRQPLKPGSAGTRLADALGTKEQPTGIRAAPHVRD